MSNIDTANCATITDSYEFSVHINDLYKVLKNFEQRIYTEHGDFEIEVTEYISSNNISSHVTLLKLGKRTYNSCTTRFYYVYNITGDNEPTKNYCDTVSDIYKFILDMGQQ